MKDQKVHTAAKYKEINMNKLEFDFLMWGTPARMEYKQLSMCTIVYNFVQLGPNLVPRVGQYGLFATNTITIQLPPNWVFTIQLQYNTLNDF